jgi:hypothetical protein
MTCLLHLLSNSNGLEQEYDIVVSLNFVLGYFGTNNYFVGVFFRVLLKMGAYLKKHSFYVFKRKSKFYCRNVANN